MIVLSKKAAATQSHNMQDQERMSSVVESLLNDEQETNFNPMEEKVA